MPINNQPVAYGAGKQSGMDTGTPMVKTPLPLRKAKKDKLKLDKPTKKLNDIIDVRPEIKGIHNSESVLHEAHGVFTFGRMNPPHAGHQAVVDKVADVAKKNKAKHAHVVVSHSQDKKKNPLDQKTKSGYVSKMNPNVKVKGSSKEHPNFLSYAKKMHGKGVKHLHVVTGDDRKDEFHKTLSKYNGHKDHYNFKSITVHSAGARDSKASGVSGASGTKQREYAKTGDYKSFHSNLPKSLQKHGKDIYNKIREEWEDYEIELALTEQAAQELIKEDALYEDYINERVMTLMQRRKAGLKMRRLRFKIARMRKIKRKRMATRDMLQRRARRQARNFIRKRIAGKQGANYSLLSPSQKIQIDKRVEKKAMFINKLAMRLLPKVKQSELVRLRNARLKKEQLNTDFNHYISEIRDGGETSNRDKGERKEFITYSEQEGSASSNPKIKQLAAKHKNEDDQDDKRQAIEKEKLKAQMARTKQAEIRREARDVSEAVDVMVDALAALDQKAQIAGVELDTLFIEFVEGYHNPHGMQTAQQGGFAAVNRLLAEMSDAQKNKAEDIVKGMKKKASYFKKKYGKDAKSVMYATANKMAQEDVQESLKDWFGKGKKGDWIRVGTDGKIKGDCAREEGEGKPKCMPRSKAHSMSKKDRASAARRKRAADPVADRAGKGGKPVMVKTDKVNEKFQQFITPKEKDMMKGRKPFNPKKGLQLGDIDVF